MPSQAYIPPHKRNLVTSSPWRSSPSLGTSPPWRTPLTATSSPPNPSSHTKSSALIDNWRTNANPLRRKVLPNYKDVKEGQLCWLPPTPPSNDSKIYKKLDLEAPTSCPFGHTVVVTRKWEENGEEYVDFRTCTSFSSRGGIKGKPEHQRRYFLHAEGPESQDFKKDTYVTVGAFSDYPIEYKHLEVW